MLEQRKFVINLYIGNYSEFYDSNDIKVQDITLVVTNVRSSVAQ